MAVEVANPISLSGKPGPMKFVIEKLFDINQGLLAIAYLRNQGAAPTVGGHNLRSANVFVRAATTSLAIVSLSNVIALCPGHHKEAHFGKEQEKLERAMVEIVIEKTG